MNIVVDNLLTNYKLSGKGKLVVLLHGWGDSLEGLAGLQKRLAAHYQVLSVDLPGFGNTQAPPAVWGLDEYARFVAAVLEKLDLKQPYAVIGHSNGGALAIRATGNGVLEPQKVVLLAASGIRTNNPGKRFFLKILAKTGNIATLWMPERYRRGLRKSLYGTVGSDMLAVPHLQETFKKTVRQDVQGDAAAIQAPTLLIYGADDEDVPPADGERYKQLISDSRLEIIGQAGHFIHHDQPEKVAGLIEDFLK